MSFWRSHISLKPEFSWSAREGTHYGLFRRRQWHPTPVLLPGNSHGRRSLVGCSPVSWTFTFQFHALEKEMATHSSVLAWRIPGTGEPGGLPSLGSHRVGHDWSDLAAAAAWSISIPGGFFKIGFLKTVFFFFWFHYVACGMLVPWPGLEPESPALEA